MSTSSAHGESSPPPSRACYGRDELIAKVVGLAENLEPVALIGAGGIGKTSIALSVLHHDRIKKTVYCKLAIRSLKGRDTASEGSGGGSELFALPCQVVARRRPIRCGGGSCDSGNQPPPRERRRISSYRGLGNIFIDKGEGGKAFDHFEKALGIASTFKWDGELLWINDSLAKLSLWEDRFDEENT